MPPSSETRASTGRLTDTVLRSAKPREKAYKISAGGGLYLEVMPSGSKLWRWKYRLAGKENRFAIGAYPGTLLKEAKILTEQARDLVKSGVHPSHQKKLDDIAKVNEHANTFEAVGKEWLAENASSWTYRTRIQRENALKRHVFPRIGSLPVRQVAPAHVLEIIKRVEKTAPAMAGLLNQAIGAICRRAVVTLRADADPTGPIRGSLKPRKVEHHRPLSDKELPRFIRAIDDSSSYFSNKIALKLMLLTLARSVEIIEARWAEFDLENGLWTVPPERMKMEKEHLVPLPAQALEELAKLKVISGDREFLFPNRDQPSKAASRGVLWKAVAHMGFDKRFSPHGVRSTGSTILNGMGYRADLIETQLAHQERNKSRASYNQATYIEERREMMQAWANYLDALVTGAEVVPLNSKAAA